MDAVTRIIGLLEQAPREAWETTLCRELGGTTLYVRATTGLQKVRLLAEIGIPRRTASWKVRGR